MFFFNREMIVLTAANILISKYYVFLRANDHLNTGSKISIGTLPIQHSIGWFSTVYTLY